MLVHTIQAFYPLISAPSIVRDKKDLCICITAKDALPGLLQLEGRKDDDKTN
jgi:hypothetical protein